MVVCGGLGRMKGGGGGGGVGGEQEEEPKHHEDGTIYSVLSLKSENLCGRCGYWDIRFT